MEIHNVDLFHCLKCGKVVRREKDAPVPTCCGEQMVKAAAQTVPEKEGESSQSTES